MDLSENDTQMQRHLPADSWGSHTTSRSEALSFDSEHLLRSENLPFDIDAWYPALQRWTFRSVFLPLQRSEMRALIRGYRARFLHKPQALISSDDARVLTLLEQRIGSVIQRDFNGNAFFRLCGRSAKDGEPHDRERVRKEYAAALDAVTSESKSEAPSDSDRMRAVGRVALLKVTSGADVLSLMLSSERVYSDMLDWAWYGEPEQICLRAWEPELTLENEFRAYICDGKLCAISQYDHYCHYPGLATMRGEIERQIRALWAEMHPHVGVASYGIDFGWLPHSQRLVMVELSPFLRCTGAHCFRWSNAKDVDVLEGRAPFEFRLVRENPPGFGSMLDRWLERWDVTKDGEQPPFWQLWQTAKERAASVARRSRGVGVVGVGKVLMMLSPLFALAAVLVHYANYTVELVLLQRAALVVACAAVGWAIAYFFSRQSRQRGQAAAAAATVAAAAASGKRHRLFVYGTLKKGMHWHTKFLSASRYLGAATTTIARPLVVGACGVPYLLDRPGTGQRVRGEVYEIDSDTLEGLDDYEGLSKGYYARIEVSVDMEDNDVGVSTKTAAAPLIANVYLLQMKAEAESGAATASAAAPAAATAADREEHAASAPASACSPDERCDAAAAQSKVDVNVLFTRALSSLPPLEEYTIAMHRERYAAVKHIELKQRIYLAGRKQYSTRRLHPAASVLEDLPDH